MTTRYVFTQDTKIYFPNGLRISNELLPSKNAVEYFVSSLLHDILVKVNPLSNHKCSNLCGQACYVHLGFPNNQNVLVSCPDASYPLIRDFEELLEGVVFGHDEKVCLQTVAIRFLPCPKILEVLDLAIYL